jgi:hypothetical protein
MPNGTWIYGATARKYYPIISIFFFFKFIISDENSGKAASHELKGAQALHHHARSCSHQFPNVEMLFPLVALVGLSISSFSILT